MPRPTPTFTRFVALPENRAALLAVQDLAAAVASNQVQRLPQPLYLHGPAGCGKSHLACALASDIARRCPQFTIGQVTASQLTRTADSDSDAVQGRLFDEDLTARNASDGTTSSVACAPGYDNLPRESDVVIVEDIQHLAAGLVEPFTQFLDEMLAHRRPVLITGLVGPVHLEHRKGPFPARLTSRLAAGLVVGLHLLAVPSRKVLLAELAQRRQLAVAPEVLDWVAHNLSGGVRALEGAINTLHHLAGQQRKPLDTAVVAEHFREQAAACELTVERIADRVGGYYRVPSDQLQSRSRLRGVLVPRQISMYLARQLTGLSLDQIGAYFGGRDHTTVLHACRKVEAALTYDAALSGAVRQLQAELV